jgi:hypothetical protein
VPFFMIISACFMGFPPGDPCLVFIPSASVLFFYPECSYSSSNLDNNIGLYHEELLEVVSKPPFRPNFCVGPRDSILEILNIFLRLNPSLRLDFEPD